MAEIAREVLERLAEADNRVMRGGFTGAMLDGALNERERALDAYRDAKAAAEPKLRTRAEVDADIALITREYVEADECNRVVRRWQDIQRLCAESYRADPAPEPGPLDGDHFFRGVCKALRMAPHLKGEPWPGSLDVLERIRELAAPEPMTEAERRLQARISAYEGEKWTADMVKASAPEIALAFNNVRDERRKQPPPDSDRAVPDAGWEATYDELRAENDRLRTLLLRWRLAPRDKCQRQLAWDTDAAIQWTAEEQVKLTEAKP